MMIDAGHSQYEIEVGGRVMRNDRLGPRMIVDDVFEEVGIVWIKFACDDDGQPWPATLFVPA
jgi:hypothetical protein